jgi:hypothetical protein
MSADPDDEDNFTMHIEAGMCEHGVIVQADPDKA